MLPLLSPLPTNEARIQPPPGFRAVTGLQSAWLAQHPPHFARGEEPRQTVAQLAGVRFEKRAQAVFHDLKLGNVRVGPWFTFRDAHGTRWCQPDILVEFRWHSLLVEVKHNHTTDAWFQLRQLYEPVIKKALDLGHCDLLVLVEHFDPSVPWPEEFELLEVGEPLKKWLMKTPSEKKMGIVRCPT